MKNKIIFRGDFSSHSASDLGFARESWPVAGDADKQREAEWNQHEQEVMSNVAPATGGMGEKGQAIHSVGGECPDDLPQAKVPAFPGAEGGENFPSADAAEKFLS